MNAAIRRFVRQRAQNRCEYCRLPEAAAAFLSFHVEHIQAQQHVEDSSPENLALACPHCNLHKGPNLTSIDPDSREVVELFNPRTHDWAEHFELDGPLIVGLSQIGRVTARLLNMNADEQVSIREGLLRRNEF
jgi:hypothetical protein